VNKVEDRVRACVCVCLFQYCRTTTQRPGQPDIPAPSIQLSYTRRSEPAWPRLSSPTAQGWALEVPSTHYKVQKQTIPLNSPSPTPGRLLDFIDKGVISIKKLKNLILDEADSMLDMGLSQRPAGWWRQLPGTCHARVTDRPWCSARPSRRRPRSLRGTSWRTTSF